MNGRQGATTAAWPLPAPGPNAVTAHPAPGEWRRRCEVPAPPDAPDRLAVRQRAMAELPDWLPVAAEQADRAEWVTREAPGRELRYRIVLSQAARSVRIDESLSRRSPRPARGPTP